MHFHRPVFNKFQLLQCTGLFTVESVQFPAHKAVLENMIKVNVDQAQVDLLQKDR